MLEQGGAKVIYQPGADYFKLPEEKRYLHVRHEVDGDRVEAISKIVEVA